MNIICSNHRVEVNGSAVLYLYQVMYCSGIKEHLDSPMKYPALNMTYETTTIALKADWNCSSSEASECSCSVITSISSIQPSMGMPKDLMYIFTASVIEW